jgi:hypothetical protein
VPTPREVADAVAAAAAWNARVALVRRVPEEFGTAQHAAVYATIADRVYVPSLKPDFAYVRWREDFIGMAPTVRVDRAFVTPLVVRIVAPSRIGSRSHGTGGPA